ncbi:ATP-binding protein [Mycolicibacterium pyrenivorans]|uniref:ATP-binding protein n=1 Tax=Mycolicibacterium pyrenivorans TaxID=187102 RepID=UPI0021F28C13|nr:ATP-binding protein [Mycolicibacterium pyrenivorans]MCV7152101.1 AAA family ATPase [Mycolicibacterium pyrenivorans]
MSEPHSEATEPGAGYRLQYAEVYNWGTFDDHAWRFTPGTDTALLTGDIGSGKSTIVDALTTLLVPAHKAAYNKAAGADAKERTLRSYVEGHYKSERNESTGRSRPKGLRENKRSYSVILGVFRNHGHDETVTLAQVFQQRESTGQPYRFFVTSTKELSIATDFADFGTDLRELRRRLRAAGAEIFDEFPKYSTSLRRLLGIRSEQALELFHQTVSMKSVGNLNDFVRDHMLEPSDSTERVREIIGHFEDLTKAHDAVKRAREQLEALQPIVDTAAKYDAALAERAGLELERAAVRLFIAELRSGLLTDEIARLEADGAVLLTQRDTAEAEQRKLGHERDSLIEERATAGGDRIGELERLADEAREQAKMRSQTKALFDAAVADAGLEPVADGDAFAALGAAVAAERPRLTSEKRELDTATVDAIGREREHQRRCDAIAEEVASLEQRTDNLPQEQVVVRAELCAALGLTPDDLPYAGELLDVYDEHARWRGAAERVLRGFALSLLVPQRHYDAVTAWVNGRRLTVGGRGAKLVYERVPAHRVRLQPTAHDGLLLADCIEVRDGQFEEYLRAELMKRADFRCAVTLDEFRNERRAVTREGQVRSGDRHEKDDRHRVDDPRRWVLGWVNERKIAAMRAELAELESQRDEAAAEASRLVGERDAVQHRLDALRSVEGFRSWVELDVGDAEARAKAYDAERVRLQAGSTRLAEITQALERNAENAVTVTDLIKKLTGMLATAQSRMNQAQQERSRDDEFVAAQAPDHREKARASYPALTARLANNEPVRATDCAASEAALSDDLHRRIERLSSQLNGHALNLTQHMTAVLNRWQELRADMDVNVESRADFLAFRERVATDDLPRFESEFKEQLNKNAIQELAGFNNWLGRQASAIDERVDRINDALGAVPYNPGRYIKLEKEPTSNQDVAQFRSDLRNLTNDTLTVDGDQYSEQRFLDVKRIIERFRGRDGYAESDKNWTRRVTDVRNWFVFSASERDVDTDLEWEHYSDSDGKSGGQKEKLAYTILAASLAYQFGLEWGVERSRDFRFAVIDEAFGRGSDVSTRYALDLFATLGLQLLIVTPLQKVHVIEPYVKSIGIVDNPTGTFSRLQTMTIEEYRDRRDRPR